MRIFRQMSHYDCGISVTQSLIHYFYNKIISKEQLITETNISENGLSILDLERINESYGINLETYGVGWKEFVQHKTKDYFILMLKLEFGNHYVIAKKSRKGITLYDSWKGKQFLTYQDLEAYYSEVYIEFSLIKNFKQPIKVIANKQVVVNYQLLIGIFLINLVVLGLNIVSGYFIKSIFNDVIGSKQIANLATIIFVTVFGHLSMAFGYFLISSLQIKQLYCYQKKLTYELVNVLYCKSNNFFTKISSQQFVLLDWHIENIARYYTHFYHNLFVYSFNACLLILFLLLIDPRIMLVVLVALLVQVIYNYCVYLHNKRYFPKIKQLSEINKRHYFKIEAFLKNEINLTKLQKLLLKLKENVFDNTQINYKVDLSNSFIDRLNNLVNSLINLILNCLGAYLLIKQQINFGSLIMATTFFSHLTYSVNQLISFSFFWIDFKFSRQHYLTFLNVGNPDHDQKGIEWKLPQKIELNKLDFFHQQKQLFNKLQLSILSSTFLYGPSGSGKSSLYKIIAHQYRPTDGHVTFDGLPLSSFQPAALNKNIIYQKNLSYLPEQLSWSQLLSDLNEQELTAVIEIAKLINLEITDSIDPEKLSSGQNQFINLLLLINVKNKLIILDEATSHIDKTVREKIYFHIIIKIMSQNFLICSEHDHDVKKYFRHEINLMNYKHEQIYY